MDNIFTKTGGHVKYTPDRVQSNISDVQYSDEDNLRKLALERDLTAANLIENDILLDMLDAAIDEQMKEFALTVPELYEAATNLCGSPTVTWECYKKAKELLNIAPWIAYGYDPVQLTFTDSFIKRKGNVVFNCKEFDPDTFQNTTLDSNVDKALNGDETISPNELQQIAEKNQKLWATLMLFWDLLWGKPKVKPNIPSNKAKLATIKAINEEIADLRSKGKTEDADKLAKSLAVMGNLPNTIMVDRPEATSQLQWQGKNGAIEYNLKPVNGKQENDVAVNPSISAPGVPWNDDAVAVWVDYGSMFTQKDKYKDKSIPMLESGFILPILVGFLSVIPKLAFYFIKARVAYLKSIRWFYTKKVLGWHIYRLIYTPIKFFIDAITSIVAALSTIMIEACISLAMLPRPYAKDISGDDATKIKDIPQPVSMSMNVGDTIAGFVSMDCLASAQAIVNRVHQEAVNDG